MTDDGGDAPPFPASNGGEFLLSLLQKPNHQRLETPVQQFVTRVGPVQPPQQPLPTDPAVAAVGPSIPFTPPNQWPSNGRDLPPAWPHSLSSLPFAPHNYLGFPQNPNWPSPPIPPQGRSQQFLCEDLLRLGLSDSNYAIRNLVVQQQQKQQQQEQQQQQKLLFGSFQSQIQPDSLLNLNGYNFPNGLDMNRQFDHPASSISISPPKSIATKNLENSRELEVRISKQQKHYSSTPPPGFSNSGKVRVGVGLGVGGGGNSGRGFDKDKSNNGESNRRVFGSEDGKMHGGSDVGLTGQLERPGPPSGSNMRSFSALDSEESMLDLHRDERQRHWDLDNKMRREIGAGNGQEGDEMDNFGEELVDSLLPEDEKNDSHDRNDRKQHRNSRDKQESRSDNRGKRLLSQRLRNLKWRMECRSDIHRLNAPFISIYESLIPPDEEKAKQMQLLTLLEKLVRKEWPEADLYLYGSCANSFGVSDSDIDVCLAMKDMDINKSEVLLKLADILQSDNLQNVQPWVATLNWLKLEAKAFFGTSYGKIFLDKC